MSTYYLLCRTNDPQNEIYTSPSVGQSSGQVYCDGELVYQPYSPVLGDLSYSQVGELAGITIFLFVLAFLFRFVFSHIQNR